MAYLPQSHANWRSPRVRLADITPAVLRLPDGRRRRGQLETISLTGGLLSMPNMLDRGSHIQLMFLTRTGPVVGAAEMLVPLPRPGSLPSYAEEARQLQAARGGSVVLGPRPGSVDREIQSSANSSESSATGSPPGRSWVSYTPCTFGKCHLPCSTFICCNDAQPKLNTPRCLRQQFDLLVPRNKVGYQL